MELTWGIAAIWLGLALVASLLSICFKMSVALGGVLCQLQLDAHFIRRGGSRGPMVLGRQGHSRVASFFWQHHGSRERTLPLYSDDCEIEWRTHD